MKKLSLNQLAISSFKTNLKEESLKGGSVASTHVEICFTCYCLPNPCH